MAELGQTLQSRLIDDSDAPTAGDEEPTAAQLLDPVDLEARLVEARVRRAEALRRKEAQHADQPEGGTTQAQRVLGRTIDYSASSAAKTEAWTYEEPALPQLTAEGRVPVHTASMPRTTLALSAALIVIGVASGAAVAYRFLPDAGTTPLASISENAVPVTVPVETIGDTVFVDEPIVAALSVVTHPQAPVTDATPRMPGAVLSNTPEESPGVIKDGPGGLANWTSGEDRLIRVAQLSPEPLPKSPELSASAEGLVVVQEPPSPSLSPPSMPLTDVREALAKRQRSASPEVIAPIIPAGAEISLSTGAPERIIEAGLGPSPTLGPVFAPDDSSGLPFDLKASIPAPSEAQETLLSGIDAQIRVHYAPGAQSEAEELAAALIAAGAMEPTIVPVNFSISSANIRYYHAEDAAPANSVAKTAFADGIDAEVRDFTGYRPRPAAGLVEVWLSGGQTGTVAAAPAAQVAQPAAVRRAPAVTRRAPAVNQGSAEELNRLLLERRVERLLRARQSR